MQFPLAIVFRLRYSNFRNETEVESHDNKAQHAEKRLPYEIMQIIPELDLRAVIARAVKHNKPEADQEKDHRYEIVIQISQPYPRAG